jgi:hypothetical protein
MDIQSVLNILIQAIVMSFVALMVFDFADGLWGVPLPPAGWQPPVIEPTTVRAISPQPIPESAPQFLEIPDPWSLPQSPHQGVTATNSVILPFPTLRLLPPAKVNPTKTTRKTKKSPTSPKSPSTPKRKSTKPRTLTA